MAGHRLGSTPVVVTPDQAIYRHVERHRTHARDERDADERQREQGHDRPDLRIRICRRGKRWYLVPEGVEPKPRLPRVVAGLVHHSPLTAEQMLLRSQALQIAAVREEEQRLREVRLVEAVRRYKRAVERAAAS